MGKSCFYCGKKPVVGNKVSHSNIKTKIRSHPNLQRVRAVVDKKACRVAVCTRCLRSGMVSKPTVNRRPVVAVPEVPAAATA